mmetsp:Transcript_11970/g.14950  ORF Transcript_11970/g.14950 Transcript_11970/m.14950 type:complete len:216 (-) Transcript_11970:264-911(-)|eukprot:CAMPEP_0172497948 /NCGR_PEP_ID=MMETSP1066-20121228/107392_1 /TAXON_ID=671091 /ORGANISM="Coscinodiscus wailesii, Strain CCMP2513" /LENGTH=215 /DNA_ID=CAMNT_0013270995 /DNA_START=154 /DNA_END=801 /DNA_ORIENTATION=+
MAPLLVDAQKDDAKDTILNENTIVSLEREMELESQLTEIQKQMYISEVEHDVMKEKIHKLKREKTVYQIKYEKLRKCTSQLKSAYNLESVDESGEQSKSQDDGKDDLIENGVEEVDCWDVIDNGAERRLDAIELPDTCLKSDAEFDGIVQDKKVSLTKLTDDNEVLSRQLVDVKRERDYSLRRLAVLSMAIQQLMNSTNHPLARRMSAAFRLWVR